MSFPPSHSFIFHHDHQQPQHHPLRTTPPSVPAFPSFPPHHHHFPAGGGGGGGGGSWMKRSMSFSGIDTTKNCGAGADELALLHGDDELSDDGSQIGEKKKRLGMEQVKALEKSFEAGNKLDPERKMQLAKALGLQPRQIAIWFQNRRARWKTKQLEKEYEVLKKQFDAVKADNDSLKTQNQKLHAELEALKGSREWCENGTMITLKKENEGSWSNNGSDNSSDMNLDLSRTPVMNSPVSSSHNNNNNNNKSLVLPNNSLKPTSITQLLQCSSSSRSDLQDEGFCNMFHNIDEQHQNFWPWPTTENHHHFH